MKVNMKIWDRIIRGILAGGIIALAIIFQIWWILIFAAILLFTAISGFCPLYLLFKTCRARCQARCRGGHCGKKQD